ncbi:DHA2 family efflux MFS transporter permease subunit [Nocardioides mangrovicus]|uniref:DHA2 family efflux MFS transporter permease subunit n=1 Tax=Nocardioides mangrovicus TaxID=2478913 RepID=A0A3L8NY33_9ACTN|nr:MFS transporter [Nocardioides mangrovicus]RLV47741.1 DHA2 family efflux MFS transporter permease subunit [Nocardioides mangrovicus]
MAAKWWTLVAVCTGVFMLLLDVTIVNVALPDIEDQFSGSLSDLQWVIDAYALSLAALLLTAGSLADLYGRKRVFIVGAVVFTAGSTLCGAAPSLLFLTLARAAQGVGGAAMFATALALIASAFHGKDRGTAFGVFGATTGIAIAVGPVLGGVLTSGLSWRWIFFVNIPICVVALVVSFWKVEESHDPRAGRPDLIGFVTFSVSLGSLVYGLIEAGRRGWGDERVLICFGAAAVLLVVFLVSQLVQRHPMFDLSLLRKPTFTGGLFAAFGVSASIFSLLTYLVIYVQNFLGYSAVQTGVRFLFLSGASFVAAAVAGRLTSHVPAKWLIAPGFLVLGGGLLLIHGFQVDSSWTHLIPGLLVAGLGIGMINTPLASTAVGVVSHERSGMASGVNSTFRQVGVATGIAALGSIFSHQVANGLGDRLAGSPVAGRVGQIAEALTGGQAQQVLAHVPAASRASVGRAMTASYVDALNDITLIAAGIAFAAAVLTLLLVRQKDFVTQGGPPPQQQDHTPQHLAPARGGAHASAG